MVLCHKVKLKELYGCTCFSCFLGIKEAQIKKDDYNENPIHRKHQDFTTKCIGVYEWCSCDGTAITVEPLRFHGDVYISDNCIGQ